MEFRGRDQREKAEVSRGKGEEDRSIDRSARARRCAENMHVKEGKVLRRWRPRETIDWALIRNIKSAVSGKRIEIYDSKYEGSEWIRGRLTGQAGQKLWIGTG